MKIAFIAVALVFMNGCTRPPHDNPVTPSNSPAVQALLNHLAKKPDRSSHIQDYTENLAVEAGPDAADALKSLLREKSKAEDRTPILTALAYSGGVEAEAHLRQLAHGQPPYSVEMTMWLFTVPTSDQRPTIQELTKLLPGESYGDEWPRTMMASLALGVIGDKEALPALLEVANKNEGRGAEAARMAAAWLAGIKPKVSFASRSEDDELIAQVVAHAPAALGRSKAFCEAREAPRTFTQASEGVWTVTEGCKADLPVLMFKSARSSDGKRALLTFSAHFGSLDAIGYDYILWRNSQGTWSVRGVINTWIS